jgi:inorganic triphosphatase YgiF
MATAENLEIEIKIQLESFADYLKLIGYLGSLDRLEHHLNAFFDSPDRKLSAAGYALRVRATDTAGSVTLKSRGSQSEAVAVRHEFIGEIGSGVAREVIRGRIDLMSLECAPIAIVREKFPDLKPILLLQFRNHRQFKRYFVGETEYDLEIDKTEFADGSIDYELEVELADETESEPVTAGLEKIFATLAMPFLPQTKSKFERALERG